MDVAVLKSSVWILLLPEATTSSGSDTAEISEFAHHLSGIDHWGGKTKLERTQSQRRSRSDEPILIRIRMGREQAQSPRLIHPDDLAFVFLSPGNSRTLGTCTGSRMQVLVSDTKGHKTSSMQMLFLS